CVTPVHIARPTGSSHLLWADSIELALSNDELPCCASADCEWAGRNGSSPFRRVLLGGPFYVANAVPTILEYCPDFDDEDSALSAQSLSGRGRRLITFPDSRQGTARVSGRMQQESDRSRVRGTVYFEHG